MIFSHSLKDLLMIIPGVLIALTVHELSHGLAAYLLGDKTAKYQGRLTLNPFAHIDWIGFICMVFAGVGWAKPVPVAPYNFKMKNKKLGMAITALAGPLSNFLLAVVFIFIYCVLKLYTDNPFLLGLSDFLYQTAVLSLGLMAFNLLPVPPLDGSKIILPLLPNRFIFWVSKYEKYISLGLMVLLLTGLLDGIITSVTVFFYNIVFTICVNILYFVGLII